MAYNKTIWENLPSTNTPINETNLNKLENGLELVADEAIFDSDLTANNGYIRYENGLQIAWKSARVTAGGTSWENLYYSDHSMGNWAASFKTIYNAVPSISATQYWCSTGGYSATSAGTVRAYRPNSQTLSAVVSIIGIGLWK